MKVVLMVVTERNEHPTDGGERRTLDRSELWLGLLRRLTERFPRWAAWKNVDSAFAGRGDIDSLAPPEDWEAIRDEFVGWSTEHGFGPVIVCPHVLMGPHLVTLQPGADRILQLDVKERATFRGSTLIDVPTLERLSVMDERGFRRIRAGADGVVRLCSNAILPGGRCDPEALRTKRIPQLLASDPEGVELMARRFGPARRSMLDGAAAVVEGGWNRPAMRRVEAWAHLRASTEPRTAFRRLWFARVTKPRCSLLRVIRENDRRVPADTQKWLREVAANHLMVPTRS